MLLKFVGGSPAEEAAETCDIALLYLLKIYYALFHSQIYTRIHAVDGVFGAVFRGCWYRRKLV